MEKLKVPTLILLVLVLAFVPETMSNPPARTLQPGRPLCSSQFSLVNYACAFIPLFPLPPSPPPPGTPFPSPPSPDEMHGSGRHHGHIHSHHHGHRHRQRETPEEQNCCRWLMSLDNECVCDLLVHLPPFLSRPAHSYTVIVEDSCRVEYTCGGRVKP